MTREFWIELLAVIDVIAWVPVALFVLRAMR